MPVKTDGLHMASIHATPIEFAGHDGEGHNTSDNMRQVQTSDAEEGGSKQGRSSQGILEEPPAVLHHFEPLANVQGREERSKQHGRAQPSKASRLVVVFGDRKSTRLNSSHE